MTIEHLTYKNEQGLIIHTPGSNFWTPRRGVFTVEHEFQAAKTLRWDEKIFILTAGHPGEAKKLGRKCTLRPDWDAIKTTVMGDLVLKKSLAEPLFVDWLLETGDQVIEEGNWWHDNFWGICRCGSCSGGENYLGKILMEVRKLAQSYAV